MAEFRRLMGLTSLFEEAEMQPVELEDQIDPEDQIEPDDEAERNKAEMRWKQVVDMTDKKKIVYDGARTGTAPPKKKSAKK